MRTDIRKDRDWGLLKSFLPADLTVLARATGALARAREIRSGEDLLRLSLAYSDREMSLRQVSAWARESGLASLSDVAVLKRLRSAVPFLRALASHLMPKALASGASLRVIALDATTISRKRSKGTDFVAHLTYDLSSSQILGVELTRASGGERLSRAAAGDGDLVIADRGYPGRDGISELDSRGAKVLLRIQPGALPLTSLSGEKISAVDLAGGLEPLEILDVPVLTYPKKGAKSVQGRLIILRKTDEMAALDQRRLKHRARLDKREIGEKAVLASRIIAHFTTLTTEQADAKAVLETYRMRWQIEILFKRAKGIVSLGELAAKDMELCEAVVLSKLIVMLLIQACEASFFPWGHSFDWDEPAPGS